MFALKNIVFYDDFLQWYKSNTNINQYFEKNVIFLKKTLDIDIKCCIIRMQPKSYKKMEKKSLRCGEEF